MKEKLVKIWAALRPEQKRKMIIAGALLFLTVVSFGLYKSTRGGAPPPPPSVKKEINLGAEDKNVLEKSLYNESTKTMDAMKTQMEDLQKQLKAVQESKAPEAPSLPGAVLNGRNLPGLMAKDGPHLPPAVQPPPVPSVVAPAAAAAPFPPGIPPSPVREGIHSAALPPPLKPEIYGGIRVVSQTEVTQGQF